MARKSEGVKRAPSTTQEVAGADSRRLADVGGAMRQGRAKGFKSLTANHFPAKPKQKTLKAKR